VIGIICPSQFEYEALDRKTLQEKHVALVTSGMGKLRASHACFMLREEHPDLEAILLIGFAGALTPNLKIGDVIEPNTFIEQDYNAEPLEKFPNQIQKARPTQLLPESRDAVMLTQDKFLKENPYRDGPYAEKFKHLACDMESYAVAFFCRVAQIDCAVVKLISDCADETADHDFLKACQELSPKLNRVVLQAVDAIRDSRITPQEQSQRSILRPADD